MESKTSCRSLDLFAVPLGLEESRNLCDVAMANETYAHELQENHKDGVDVLSTTVKLYWEDVRTKCLPRARAAMAKRSGGKSTRFSYSHYHSAQAAEYFFRTFIPDDHASVGAFTPVGKKVGSITVLNFANGHQAGGGYLCGSRAQEEALCRQFPLYHPSLEREQRSLYTFGAAISSLPVWKHSGPGPTREYSATLFTPDVPCQRDDAAQGFRPLDRSRIFSASFVAAAAPDLSSDVFDKAGVAEGVENVIVGTGLHQFFSGEGGDGSSGEGAATPPPLPEHRVLILGAWGCGAFRNNPRKMAQHFTDCLKRIDPDLLATLWTEIHFAVPAYRPSDAKNQDAFEQALRQMCGDDLVVIGGPSRKRKIEDEGAAGRGA